MSEIELEIGDVLQIGNRLLTVVDIESGEVFFRIEETRSGSCNSAPFAAIGSPR